jgi:glucokinase
MSAAYTTLAIDIGGTNIRLGLLEADSLRPKFIQSYKINEFAGLAEAIDLFLSKAPDHQIKQAAIDVATPVTQDTIKLTNHSWAFSMREIRERFGFERLKVINDFTAMALSIPLLEPSELKQVGGGSADPDGAIALLGAGTGLGVSGLIRSAAGWYPLAGEGGHVTLGARNARELAIFAAFWEKYGHMSAERLLSGTGLEEFYQVICRLDGLEPELLKPADISGRAIAQTCPACMETMSLFCEWFGIVAANLTLTLGATGGVYVGGGIVPNLGDYFVQSGFRTAFETKGRFRAFMQSVPVYIIQADNPALRGAAASLNQRFDKIGLSCTV